MVMVSHHAEPPASGSRIAARSRANATMALACAQQDAPLACSLHAAGRAVLETRQPAGTVDGQAIRIEPGGPESDAITRSTSRSAPRSRRGTGAPPPSASTTSTSTTAGLYPMALHGGQPRPRSRGRECSPSAKEDSELPAGRPRVAYVHLPVPAEVRNSDAGSARFGQKVPRRRRTNEGRGDDAVKGLTVPARHLRYKVKPRRLGAGARRPAAS